MQGQNKDLFKSHGRVMSSRTDEGFFWGVAPSLVWEIRQAPEDLAGLQKHWYERAQVEVERFKKDFPTWNKTRGRRLVFLLNLSQALPEQGEGFSVDVVRTKENKPGVMLTPLKSTEVTPDFTQLRMKFAAFVKADMDACHLVHWQHLALNVLQMRGDPELQPMWEHLVQRLGENYPRASDWLLVQRFLGLFFQDLPPEPPQAQDMSWPTPEQHSVWHELCEARPTGQERVLVTPQNMRDVCSLLIHYPHLFTSAEAIDFSMQDEKLLHAEDSALARFVHLHMRSIFKNKREIVCLAYPGRFYLGTPVAAGSLPKVLCTQAYDHFLLLSVSSEGQSRWDVPGTPRPEIRPHRLVLFTFFNERGTSGKCVLDQLTQAQNFSLEKGPELGKKAMRVMVCSLDGMRGQITPFRALPGGDFPPRSVHEPKLIVAERDVTYDGYIVHRDERYAYLEPHAQRDRLVLFPYSAALVAQWPGPEQRVRVVCSAQKVLQWVPVSQETSA